MIMTIFELQTLSKLNKNLPPNVYFSYRSQEIIEFNTLYTISLELKNGDLISVESIDINDIKVSFD